MGHAENAITRSILAAIALQGDRASFVRVQAGSIRIGNRLIRMAAAGTADLVGSYRGRAIALEVKTAKGKQAETQAAWEKRWASAGGIYAVVRSAAEVLELFTQIDAMKPGPKSGLAGGPTFGPCDQEADGAHPPRIS